MHFLVFYKTFCPRVKTSQLTIEQVNFVFLLQIEIEYSQVLTFSGPEELGPGAR